MTGQTWDPVDPGKTLLIDRDFYSELELVAITNVLCWPVPTTCATV